MGQTERPLVLTLTILAIETPMSRCTIRGHTTMRMRTSYWLGFCDTPRVLHSVLDLSSKRGAEAMLSKYQLHTLTVLCQS